MGFRSSCDISTPMAMQQQVRRQWQTIGDCRRALKVIAHATQIPLKWWPTKPNLCEKDKIFKATGRTPVCALGSGTETKSSSTDSISIGPIGAISRFSQTAITGQKNFVIGSSERFQKPRQNSISASLVTWKWYILIYYITAYFTHNQHHTWIIRTALCSGFNSILPELISEPKAVELDSQVRL